MTDEHDDIAELDEELSALEPEDAPAPFDDDPPDDEPDAVEDPEVDAASSGDTAEIKAELERLRQEKEAERLASAQAELEARRGELERKEAELSAQRRAALESDDLEEYDRLDAELDEVRAYRRAMPQQVQPQQAQGDNLAPAARDWISRNPRFNSDPAFRDQAIALSKRLKEEEGMDLTHPKFYAELDRRMSRTPRMSGDTRNGAPVSRANPRQDTASASRQDARWMEKFGIDPGNKAAQAEWARSKKAVQKLSRGAR